jgi:hypothetical protein
MQAQFVREVDGDVTFIKDGKLITFPLDQLSEADQKFIREAETDKKVEEKARPAGAPAKDLDPGGLLPADSFSPAEPKSNLTKQRTVVEERTWRDLRGKQTVGKFVRMHDGNVVLLRGGRVVSIPFATLSRADRDYVRELLTARGETSQLPAEMQEAQTVLVQPPRPAEEPAKPEANAPISGPEPSQLDSGSAPPPQRNQPAEDRVASRSIPTIPSAPSPVPNRARAFTDRLRTQFRGNAATAPGGVRVQRQVNWAAMLIGGSIGAVIGSLIGAVILRAAASWVLGYDVAYGDAFVTMFLASLLNFGASLGVGFAYGMVKGAEESTGILSFILLPVGFLIQSGVISSKLDTDFGSACKVTLAMYAIGFAIALLLGGIFLIFVRSTT